MTQFLAMVAYRGLISGIPSGSLDVQVRWYSANTSDEVRRLLTDEPMHSYENTDGEIVTWELVEIFQIEPFAPRESGDEVVGFIAKIEELTRLV